MVSKFKLDDKNLAKEEVKRTLEVAKNYAGELSIEVLSLDNVELDPENNRDMVLTLDDAVNGLNKDDPDYARKLKDWHSLESLSQTIKDGQLINPIFVYRYGNKCRLIAGERRTLASAIAGKKEIIARISSERPIGTQLKVLQWIENNERSDLSLAERVLSVDAIIVEYKKENSNQKKQINAEKLSELTGMSARQSLKYLRIIQSPKEIKNAVIEGKIKHLDLVDFILSIKSKETQLQLLSAALDGASLTELSKMKKEMEAGVLKKPKDSRGRKKTNIKIGGVKPSVAKIILNALTDNVSIPRDVSKKIQDISKNLEWDDISSAEKSLKKIIEVLNKSVQ